MKMNSEIGRKISPNVQSNFPSMFKKGLQISNPGVLRIIGKWCESLEELYFSKSDQILKQTEAFKMTDGS